MRDVRSRLRTGGPPECPYWPRGFDPGARGAELPEPRLATAPSRPERGPEGGNGMCMFPQRPARFDPKEPLDRQREPTPALTIPTAICSSKQEAPSNNIYHQRS